MKAGEVERVKEENIEKSDGQVYELGYLFVPNITEEDLSVHYGNLKDLVASLGGDMISDDMPKMMTLAYTMAKVTSNVRTKYDNAYFGWMKFTMEKDKVGELKKKLDLNPQVIRFLIMKTVKENTIASRRFVGRDMPHRKMNPMWKPEEKGEAAPINKEEIDKEIEAMVATQ